MQTPVKPEDFEKWMKQLGSLLKMVKMLAGLVIAIGTSFIAVIMWVSSTKAEIVATREDVARMAAKQTEDRNATADRLKDWGPWRGEMDRTMTKIVTIQDNQQRLMERLNDKIDRIK